MAWLRQEGNSIRSLFPGGQQAEGLCNPGPFHPGRSCACHVKKGRNEKKSKEPRKLCRNPHPALVQNEAKSSVNNVVAVCV